jgi:hypothetical protein
MQAQKGDPFAFMSHGTAGTDWESLESKEDCCDMAQHENGSAAKAKPLKILATPAGFEPATLSFKSLWSFIAERELSKTKPIPTCTALERGPSAALG